MTFPLIKSRRLCQSPFPSTSSGNIGRDILRTGGLIIAVVLSKNGGAWFIVVMVMKHRDGQILTLWVCISPWILTKVLHPYSATICSLGSAVSLRSQCVPYTYSTNMYYKTKPSYTRHLENMHFIVMWFYDSKWCIFAVSTIVKIVICNKNPADGVSGIRYVMW